MGDRDVRVAVVGHIEWVEFVRVERVPLPGEIAHAGERWEEPAGGGGVAAVQLRRLAGEATLYTVLGDDELGYRAADGLRGLGVRVEAVHRGTQRRALTYIDDRGERTITTIGERLTPSGSDALRWSDLERTDAVYLTAGDGEAIRAARAARVLVATARILADLQAAGVLLDALVGSGSDPDERYEPGMLYPEPHLLAMTAGDRGGAYRTSRGETGTFGASPLPGPFADTYGAGDSFAAGLTYALALGQSVADALAQGAHAGAEALTRRGAHGDGEADARARGHPSWKSAARRRVRSTDTRNTSGRA